jgi:2-oxoglutarate dehydrogenase E1 component
MGALSFLMLNTNELFSNYIARPASAATATGFSKQHAKEQQSIIDAVFTTK